MGLIHLLLTNLIPLIIKLSFGVWGIAGDGFFELVWLWQILMKPMLKMKFIQTKVGHYKFPKL